MSDRGRWLKFLIAIGGSLFFAFLFVRGVDLDEVADALGDADYVYVLPALALFAVSVVARSVRWRYFFLPQPDLTWRQLLPSVLIGYAGNNLLPLRAGELLRAQHLAERYGIARMQTFGGLLMERLFDGAALAAFVVWGLLLADIGAAYLGAGLILGAGSIGGFVFCLVVVRKPAITRWGGSLPLPFLTPSRREVIANLSESFLGGFSVLQSTGRTLAAGWWTVAAWLSELAMYWLISEAFNLDASFVAVAFAGAAANVSLSLPSMQGGIGPFEVVATEALEKFDIATDAAAAYALALHFFLIVPVSLVGLAVLWRSTLQRSRYPSTPTSPLPAGIPSPSTERGDS
jgi:uncharacterized protein (TIRG00374 family)